MEARPHRPTRFIGYATDSLLGVVDSGAAAAAIAAAWKSAGIPDRLLKR